eukprot:1158917-Pelagomonas_calceolata.AAC.1
MEEGQPKEQFLERLRLVAGLKELCLICKRLHAIRAAHICAQALGGLIGHLDPILENVDWEARARVAGHPQPGANVDRSEAEMDVDRNEKELRLAGMCGLGQLVIHSRGDEKAWSEQQRGERHPLQ